jgi:hypothetical protein
MAYIVNHHQQFEIVPTEAYIVRTIFRLYREGRGYKRIANFLTDEGIPTPRMSEQQRKGRRGGTTAGGEAHLVHRYHRGYTPQRFLHRHNAPEQVYPQKNQTARTSAEESEHIVIENHHQAIITYREFATVKALLESRSTGLLPRTAEVRQTSIPAFWSAATAAAPCSP